MNKLKMSLIKLKEKNGRQRKLYYKINKYTYNFQNFRMIKTYL